MYVGRRHEIQESAFLLERLGQYQWHKATNSNITGRIHIKVTYLWQRNI
jgi:hypothetical protein